MKNLEKIEEYKKQIDTKQNIASLVESIKIIGMFGDISSPFQTEKKYGYQFDIARTLFLTLFDELQNDLIKNNFIISLENISIDGLREDLYKLDQTNPILSKKISDLYNKMRNSFEYIQHTTGLKKIDLINLLLDSGLEEKVVELIVSENVPNTLKNDIFKNIVSNRANSLKRIFSIIPNSFYYYTDGKISYTERFRNLLDKNLAEFLNDPEYIEETVRTALKTRYLDESTRYDVKDIVEFFVEHNLVNMNNITWYYEQTEISSAAAGYVTGNFSVGKYLYSLGSYKQTEPTIRLNSDKVIIEQLLENGYDGNLEEFIKNKNYEGAPEKLNHLMKVILRNRAKKPNIIKLERLDKIIDILLRKTKKQDYKAMKQAITDIKENTDMDKLIVERQEFTRRLRIISDSLLESYPATKIVRDVQLTKTPKNTK